MPVDLSTAIATYRHYARQWMNQDPQITVVSLRRELDPDGEHSYYLHVGSEDEDELLRLPLSVEAVNEDQKPTGGDVDVRTQRRGRIVPHDTYDSNEERRPCPGGYYFGRWTGGEPVASFVSGGGTLGGLAWVDGKPLIVTNNHVLMSPPNQGVYGDVVYQPDLTHSGYGGYDPTDPPDSPEDYLRPIGKLCYWVPIKPRDPIDPDDAGNYVDLALVEPDEPWAESVSQDVESIGTPQGWADVSWGDTVRQSGAASSEETSGDVISPYASISLDDWNAVFHDQIEYNAPSIAGDSGALLFDEQNRVVGLHFAGDGSLSYANRIDRVRAARQANGQSVTFREVNGESLGISFPAKTLEFEPLFEPPPQPAPVETYAARGGCSGPSLLLLAASVVLVVFLLS